LSEMLSVKVPLLVARSTIVVVPLEISFNWGHHYKHIALTHGVHWALKNGEDGSKLGPYGLCGYLRRFIGS